MKKVIAVITIVTMALLMVIPAFGSFNMMGPTADGTTHVIKKTDSANVVKDGIIGANEYEKLDVELDESKCPLHLIYGKSEDFLLAEAMLATMEYYASWSDGQVNIAVKTSPQNLTQVIHMADTTNPDDFCKNVALTVSSDHIQTREKGKVCNFYYAVSLTTDTNEYQVAYYTNDDPAFNQQGNSGSYVPTPGTDFVISYTGDSVIFEWSVPFSEITATGTATAGDSVFLTIAATSGESQTGDGESVYGIGLGDFGYGISQKDAKNHASFLLSEETIGGGNGGDDTTAPDQTTEPGATTAPGTTEPGETTAPIDTSKVEVITGEDGKVTYVDKTTGETISAEEAQQISGPVANNTPAPRTGDPMIIIAAVSAIGACGAVVIKRRFF